MVYKRRSEAVGLSSEEKVNYNDKLLQYADNLDDLYYDRQEPDVDGNINFNSVSDSDFMTNLLSEGRGMGDKSVKKNLSKEDYNQSVSLLDDYMEKQYGPKDGGGTSGSGSNKDALSVYKQQYRHFQKLSDGVEYATDGDLIHTFNINNIVDDNGNEFNDPKKARKWLIEKKDFYQGKLEEYGIDFHKVLNEGAGNKVKLDSNF
jgi:hypothetical protein